MKNGTTNTVLLKLIGLILMILGIVSIIYGIELFLENYRVTPITSMNNIMLHGVDYVSDKKFEHIFTMDPAGNSGSNVNNVGSGNTGGNISNTNDRNYWNNYNIFGRSMNYITWQYENLLKNFDCNIRYARLDLDVYDKAFVELQNNYRGGIITKQEFIERSSSIIDSHKNNLNTFNKYNLIWETIYRVENGEEYNRFTPLQKHMYNNARGLYNIYERDINELSQRINSNSNRNN